MAGATTLFFLSGYLRTIAFYAPLGIQPTDLSFDLHYYMVESISIIILPIIGFVLLVIANAFGSSFGRNRKEGDLGFSLEGLALVMAIGLLLHEVLIGMKIGTNQVWGPKALDWELLAATALYVLVASAIPRMPSDKPRRWEAIVMVVAGIALYVLASLTSRPDWTLVAAVGALLLLLRALPALFSGPREPPKKTPRWASYLLRVAPRFKTTMRIFWGLAAFYFVLVAAIFQGTFAGRSLAEGCEPVTVIAFSPQPPNLDRAHTYWLILHAQGTYYVRDQATPAGNSTIMHVPGDGYSVRLTRESSPANC